MTVLLSGGWLPVREVAWLLDVPEREIRRAVAAGTIECRRISPRRSFISWKDASEWANTRTTNA